MFLYFFFLSLFSQRGEGRKRNANVRETLIDCTQRGQAALERTSRSRWPDRQTVLRVTNTSVYRKCVRPRHLCATRH